MKMKLFTNLFGAFWLFSTGLFLGRFAECAFIGRLLRNITFCGKGYVKKPANPDSIIFSETTDFSKASLENPFDKSK